MQILGLAFSACLGVAAIVLAPLSDGQCEILKLTGSPPGPGGARSIHYGEPFCVFTRDPAQITHASLIGLCSTTHHFDYGQRYVELLVTHEVAGLGCGENQNLAILPPPTATMAPTNYYLLFLVDNKGRPSNGVFVQLSH
jgi:hypothetical protein